MIIYTLLLSKQICVRLLFFLYFVFFAISCSQGGEIMDKIDQKVSNFTLTTIDSKTWSLADHSGKYILINFWATWCAPCRDEMPSLNNLQKRFNTKNLEVVGIHVGPNLKNVRSFLDNVPLDFTILLDNDLQLASLGITNLPTTLLLDKKGYAIYSAVGERHWDSAEMINFIEQTTQ